MTTTDATGPPPALEVRGLTVSYAGRPVLWEVDGVFPAGVMSAVVGPNGAGKSTLLKAALGLIPADGGQALVLGRPAARARDDVAYVPQRDAVDWDFPITVREVVEMGRYRSAGWLRRVPRSDRQLVDACLDRVGMAAYGKRQIGALSGGQRQRIFLARALAQQAPVLVMDEPFAGIDARTESSLLDLLTDLCVDEGRSVVVVHHDLGTVRARFHTALVLNVRTVGCGPVDAVLAAGALRQAYGGAVLPEPLDLPA